MTRRPSVLHALALAATLALLAPAAAHAVPPSPALRAAAEKDAKLAARIRAAEAANRDVPHASLRLRTDRNGALTYGVGAQAPTGTWNLCVILAQYSDYTATRTAGYFQNLYFGTGPGTVRGYYRDASYYDKGGPRPIDIQSGGVTLQWVTLPQTRAYYDLNDEQMARDAIAAADAAGVDFTRFDNDGDGSVDALQVVHVGRGEEDFPSDPADIWSYASEFGGTAPTADGKDFGPYSVVPEAVHDQFRGPGEGPEYWVGQQPGVLAHELGHNFGLWDLYDYGYDSQGLGDWSIMASGSWLGPHWIGETPARFDAYSAYALGFTTPVNVSADVAGVTIPRSDTSATGAFRLAKAGAPLASEYFLVENRRRGGQDEFIPGEGLLIYHVDESRFGFPPEGATRNNNDQLHYAVDVEEAHGGVQGLATDYFAGGDSGDDGDPWPGSWRNTSFNDLTDPSARYYDGSISDIAVYDIGEPYDDSQAVHASFRVEYDPTPVVTRFVIAGGSSYTNTTTPSVECQVVKAADMRFSANGGATWTPWQPYAANATVALPPGDGPKTVRAQFRGDTRIVTEASDSIGLDTVTPHASVTTDVRPSAFGWYATVPAVTLTSSEPLTSVVYYRWGSDPVETAYEWPILAAYDEGGTSVLHLRTEDYAGNRETRDVTFSVDTVAPATHSFQVAEGAETSRALVHLKPAATDAGSGVAQMRFWVGTARPAGEAGWVAYATSATLALPSQAGTYTINGEFRDKALNPAPASPRTIRYVPADPIVSARFTNAVAYDIASLLTTKFALKVDTTGTVATVRVKRAAADGGDVYLYSNRTMTSTTPFEFTWNGRDAKGARMRSASYDWVAEVRKDGRTFTRTGKVTVSRILFTRRGTAKAGAPSVFTGYMVVGSANCYVQATTSAATDSLRIKVTSPYRYRADFGPYSLTRGVRLDTTARPVATARAVHTFTLSATTQVDYLATVIQ